MNSNSFFRLYSLFLVCLFVFSFMSCGSDDDDDDTSSPEDEGEDTTDDDDVSDDDDLNDDDDLAYSFPNGFLFGAATAGFQVDMGCPTLPAEICDDTHADWYGYMTDDRTKNLWRTFLSGENPSEIGPGHWELYEEDFDRVQKELHQNGFRMSIEWSRIFPEPTFGIEGHQALLAVADANNVQHYHDMFAALKARGITPLVTLHHYTLPDWIHDGVGCTLDYESCNERGWLDPETMIPEMAKYAEFCGEEFGAEVDLWATQNEPLAVLMPGFLLPTPERTNPPAVYLKNDDFKLAMEAMIEAHAQMYDALKQTDTIDANNDGDACLIGLVYAMAPVRPLNPQNELDVEAAENIFYLWNLAFLDAVSMGMFDAELTGEQVYREDLAGRMDFVGINYKVRIALSGLPFSLIPSFSPLLTLNPLTINFDEIHTRGIYEMAMLVKDRYGLPSIITENNGQGVFAGEMEREKQDLVKHISWVSVAIDEGADVRGYFYWSLMDNIEWNHGSGVPLGLYQVDVNDPNKTRIPRETVPLYGAIAKAGGISKKLAAQYPIEE